ncbi:hypothetical protein V6N13_142003 [Hibiscus sabdariffa]
MCFLFHWWHSRRHYESPNQPPRRHRSLGEPSMCYDTWPLTFVNLLGKLYLLSAARHMACPPAADVLLVAACGSRPLAFLKFFLRLVQPFVGLHITANVCVVLEGFLALASWPQLWPLLCSRPVAVLELTPRLVQVVVGLRCIILVHIARRGLCTLSCGSVPPFLWSQLTWPALQANSLVGAARVGYHLAVRTVGRPVLAFTPIACGFATHLPSLRLVTHQGSHISQLPACVHAGSTHREASSMSLAHVDPIGCTGICWIMIPDGVSLWRPAFAKSWRPWRTQLHS